ncbi:MAG: hypothetical protein IJN88_04440 [Clostridia bacterium]|nr:hypothetical protein [Clostridia bacterium]
MVGKIISVIANYGILLWCNYKWSVDGLWLKKVRANRVITPILYYVLTPYNGKSKGKRKHKVYEFGLIILEIVCNSFSIIMVVDTLFLKDYLWNMQGWSGYIYIMIVPITGVIYMIVAAIIGRSQNKTKK